MYSDNSPLIPITLDRPPEAGVVARAWAAYCAASPHYKHDALIEIGTAYAHTCSVARLDVWLTLGQVAHETGRLTSWWSARPRRNPAGIGVNGQTRRTPHPTEPSIWLWNPEKGAYCRGYSYARWAYDPSKPGEIAAVDAHVSRLMWYVYARFDGAQAALYERGARDRGMPARARASAFTPRELGWAHSRAKLSGMGWAFPGWDYGRRIADHANRLKALA